MAQAIRLELAILPESLWRRRRYRLALLDYIIGEHFEYLSRNRARVMRRVGWNLERFTSFDRLVRLTLDLEEDRAFQHIAALDARMGMAARAVARRDFRNGAHDIEAGRKIDGLQHCALDGRLLCNGRNDDDRCNDGRKDERFFKHGGPPSKHSNTAAWTHAPPR